MNKVFLILLGCGAFLGHLDAKKEKEVVWSLDRGPINVWHPGMKIEGVNDSETMKQKQQEKNNSGEQGDSQDAEAAE